MNNSTEIKKEKKENIICKLDEHYYIVADELNYTLKGAGIGKRKGNKVIGHYGRNPKGLQQLIARWLAEASKEITADNITDYIGELVALVEKKSYELSQALTKK